ncbi:MAG: glycosyltransferase family 61 protein [Verrucomicrobia bacterium]|nr:MAG: glycosyltransferase family 61 protein [Verrucomicrobiota bacterium]
MLKRFIRRIKKKIHNRHRKKVNEQNLQNSHKLKIINPKNFGDLACLVKEKSKETVSFPKLYDLADKCSIDFIYPEIEVRRYSDAQVYSDSDFVVIPDGAMWEKFYKPQWTKCLPLDKDLLKVEDQTIYIKNSKRFISVDVGFSLCGVCSAVWAHFIVQYLPKIYYIQRLGSDINSITLIVPRYTDSQIIEIVDPIVKSLVGIKILVLQPDEVANCKILYHIGNTSYITDHANYINPSDIIIPRFVLDLLKEKLVKFPPRALSIEEGKPVIPYKKIYIGRTGYRNIINHDEIENYFIELGFEIVFPHKVNLAEKVKMFRDAAIVVGPFSSGFTNIIFCHPGTKALGFINFQRAYDGYVGTIADYFDINLMLVSGNDQDDTIHSSYSVPLDRIKEAYLTL